LAASQGNRRKGENVMSKSTWTGGVNSDWADADNWSPAGVPDASSDVSIAAGDTVASASIGTVNSITDSADLSFESAGTNTVTTFVDNTGSLNVDDSAGAGGTKLNIGGTLTNGGSLTIGDTKLSAPDEVAAAALDNTGSINLTGSSANQRLLDVAGSAGFGTAGVLSGHAELSGDAAIEFASGEITSLAVGAHLGLNGNDAFIEDSSAQGSNSALTGLDSIRFKAALDLENGASVTTGALVNNGTIALDPSNGDGRSRLTLTGALTNRWRRNLTIGNMGLSASDEVTTASLDNRGSIDLYGSSVNQALLDVTGSAGFGTAGTLTGTVQLDRDSAIEFASGQIATIAARSSLELTGSNAFVEDSTALGSNSALTGLANVAGGLDLLGASVSTPGALDDSGGILLENGSSLSIGGELTVTGRFELQESAVSSVSTAESLNNSGSVRLIGGGGKTSLATLNVSGATTNNGSISIDLDTEELAEAVGGGGSFGLVDSSLQFDSSVSSGQTIKEAGANALILEQAQSFAATIRGFGTGDTIDAANFLLSGKPTLNFVENSGGTGGTLTLTDKSLGLTANIQMTGVYTNSNFTLAPDSGTGTLVKFV
jgi:hypothetical protein